MSSVETHPDENKIQTALNLQIEDYATLFACHLWPLINELRDLRIEIVSLLKAEKNVRVDSITPSLTYPVSAITDLSLQQEDISIADEKPNVHQSEVDYDSTTETMMFTTTDQLSNDSETDSSIYSLLEDEDISLFEEELYEEDLLEEDSDYSLCDEDSEDFSEDSNYSSVESMEFVSIRYARCQSRFNRLMTSTAQADKELLSDISDNDSIEISFVDNELHSFPTEEIDTPAILDNSKHLSDTAKSEELNYSSAQTVLDFSYRSSNSNRLPGGFFINTSSSKDVVDHHLTFHRYIEDFIESAYDSYDIGGSYYKSIYIYVHNKIQTLKTNGAFNNGLTNWQSWIKSFHHQNTAEGLEGYSLFSSESIYFNILQEFNLQEQHNNYKRGMNRSI
jgi:hypothetical protein